MKPANNIGILGRACMNCASEDWEFKRKTPKAHDDGVYDGLAASIPGRPRRAHMFEVTKHEIHALLAQRSSRDG